MAKKKTKMSERYGGILKHVVKEGNILSGLHSELELAMSELIRGRAERAVWGVMLGNHAELKTEFDDEMRLYLHCQKEEIPYHPAGEIQIEPLADPREHPAIPETSPESGQDAEAAADEDEDAPP